MNLGQAIAEKRKQLGKTQRALAKELDISFQYLCDIERGNRHPTDDYLLALIAAMLHMSQDYLYYLAGILPPDIREANADAELVMEQFNAFRFSLRNRP